MKKRPYTHGEKSKTFQQVKAAISGLGTRGLRWAQDGLRRAGKRRDVDKVLVVRCCICCSVP